MNTPNLVLVGFMGSGKSSIGRRLAKKLGFKFIDTDRLVIQRAGMEISDIFAQFGEGHFRELETAALVSLAGAVGSIIATGGGIVLREENRALLRTLGFVIGLDASEDVIFERVSRNSKRPLLQTANPRETLHEIFSQRRGLYEGAAQFSIDTSALTHDEITEKILAEVKRGFPV